LAEFGDALKAATERYAEETGQPAAFGQVFGAAAGNLAPGVNPDMLMASLKAARVQPPQFADDISMAPREVQDFIAKIGGEAQRMAEGASRAPAQRHFKSEATARMREFHDELVGAGWTPAEARDIVARMLAAAWGPGAPG
jgi:hypothetical protein